MLLPILFFLATLASAQDFAAPARELARRIGRQDVSSVTVRNASSLPDSAAADVQRTLETELRVRPRPDGSAVSVTLSENVRGLVWVAEIQRGDERDVAMLDVARMDAPPARQAGLSIEKRLLWEQDRPILDVATSGSVLIVLEPGGVFFYRERRLVSSLPISSARPMPRDPRGWLEITNDAFRAFLPGVICSGVIESSAISCAENGGAGLAAGRNFFTDASGAPYYSIATLPGLRVVAGVDGRGPAPGWGSDIAAIDNGCGAGRQILASKAGDADPDSIQAFELAGARFNTVTDPALFAGSVTALWGKRAEAVVVARDSQTGRYAAYSLAITCGR